MDLSLLPGKRVDSRRLWGADRVTSHENWDTASCALASEFSLSRVTQAGMAVERSLTAVHGATEKSDTM